MATRVEHPTVRPLTREEAEVILKRNKIGRLAFALRDEVDIEPIHFVYEAPWIYGRTSPGTKLLALAQESWCAFEVDEATALFDWQSVVVKGPLEAFNSAIGKSQNFDQALAAVRRLIPGALTDKDPTPERNVVFGIRATEIEGRVSTTTSEG